MPYTTVGTVIDGDDLLADQYNDVSAAIGELQAALPEASTVFAPATVSGLTKGNGTEVARYVRIGPAVFVLWKFTFGSTSAVTGDMAITLPVNSLVQRFMGAAFFEDVSGNQEYDAVCRQGAAFSNMTIRAKTVSGSNVRSDTLLSATVPFTWATGDIIVANAWYLAA